MKKLIVLIIYSLIFNSVMASECHDLMIPFFTSDREVKIKTKKFDITKYGLEDTPENRNRFERLYAQCLSPGKNNIKEISQSKVAKIFMAMSFATSVVGYSEQNWKKPKDKDWFGQLGYQLVFGAISAKIYSKIVQDKGNRFHYLLKDYLYGRAAVVSYAGGSLILFSNDKTNQEKINKLQNSKNFKSDIEKLNKYIDDELVERYEKELFDYLLINPDINLGIGTHDGVDFDHLTPEDLKDPAVRKIVIAAILAMEYDMNKKVIATGDTNVDSFIFDSFYSLIKMPKDIVVNKISNQAMCLNLYNPARGTLQVIGLNTLNQILFADSYGISYVVLKKRLIGDTNP